LAADLAQRARYAELDPDMAEAAVVGATPPMLSQSFTRLGCALREGVVRLS
jgi:hypothetical protein